ncbi:MAG: M23 family metallopeptidase [Frankiaceae bacterium]|nr:M23 family metallopeptidase [Frankiaceae bacterium]MBV9369359.1 M23 family metallopeptidase [Frankiales bacterium]
MTPRRWFVLPAPARSALAVVVLAAFVALTIVSGMSGRAGAVRIAADSRPALATTTAPRTVAPLPDVRSALAVLGGESEQNVRASRSSRRLPVAVPSAHRWVRPYGGVFTSPFGYRWGRLHAGVDLAGPWGTTIVAATSGCIEYAGPMSGYGEVMKISDWDGTETVYGHMSSFIRTSGCVTPGEPIARIGAGGDATGPHLHFEVRIGGTPVNPVPFLAKRGVYL